MLHFDTRGGFLICVKKNWVNVKVESKLSPERCIANVARSQFRAPPPLISICTSDVGCPRGGEEAAVSTECRNQPRPKCLFVGRDVAWTSKYGICYLTI